MESIMRLARSEAMLFKFVSGTGTDLTPIRSGKEKLSGGGRPSGPMSFLKVYDQVANVVKSGGKTRRAAKMNTLRDWHGDIESSLTPSRKKRKKPGRSSNRATTARTTATPTAASCTRTKTFPSAPATNSCRRPLRPGLVDARRDDGQAAGKERREPVAEKIAEGTWTCGDPGLQYDGAIQKWHTCKGTEAIHSTNPCSEYVFINNTACNLASLNLLKFKREDGKFDAGRFKAAVRILITAQEILVDNASYPTKDIAENSHRFRTLGLGYANLGSLIMSYGSLTTPTKAVLWPAPSPRS